MKNNSFQEIYDKLKKCKKVLISLHYGPDGDSLGACTAMKYFLERDFKCKVKLISYHNLAENLSNFDFVKEIEFGKDISEENFDEYDCVLFLDSGDASFFSGKLKEKFVIPLNAFTICIDHHNTNKGFAKMNYVDKIQPSACSVILDMFRALKIRFDKELATRLLVGVCTDSGFFTYDTNPEKALKDAEFLIENEADYKIILENFLYAQPLRLKKYFGILYNNLKFDKSLKVGYSSISNSDIKKLGLNEAEVRLGPNELQMIAEFEFIFTLADMGNYIKGSFRSKKGIDVSVFAKELGGGGHKAAASFILSNMKLEEAEKKVLDAIRKVG